ncbi:hypothetical protein NMG60_11007335, partial [Bertholletia excelsa]
MTTYSLIGFPNQDVQCMIDILHFYQTTLGQRINLYKSDNPFSRNVVESHSTYLGILTFVGWSKQQIFNFRGDRVWKKLKGWKEKCLSRVGKEEVLIKSIAQSIPTCITGCLVLPKSLYDHIKSLINNFWWGSSNGKRKLYWIRWDNMHESKYSGGMGFRNFEALNLVILAKQGWCLLTRPDTLMSRIIQAKYFPKTNFLKLTLAMHQATHGE